jgi:hypothetical protein
MHAFIVVVASEDQKNFYWHVLMWLAQLAEQCDFKESWLAAGEKDELRAMVLEAWKKRTIF